MKIKGFNETGYNATIITEYNMGDGDIATSVCSSNGDTPEEAVLKILPVLFVLDHSKLNLYEIQELFETTFGNAHDLDFLEIAEEIEFNYLNRPYNEWDEPADELSSYHVQLNGKVVAIEYTKEEVLDAIKAYFA